MGILSLAFGLFQARIADISERRAQRILRASLKQIIQTGAGLGRDVKGNAHAIPTGSAVALLDIPRINVHKVVVDGADAKSLEKAPGVVQSSAIPGQPGQSIVIGRRTTFGSPFRHLDVLTAGDLIKTTTPYGVFKYSVRDSRTVDAGQATTFGQARGSLLTLVTSDPPYIGGKALVVTATLQGDPSVFSDPPRRRGGQIGEVALNGNGSEVIPVLLLGVLLLLALIATDRLYKRWRRWPTYLLTTPFVLALAFAWMEHLASLFPSSL
jgi:sortase A